MRQTPAVGGGDNIDGADATRIIMSQMPSVRIIGLSMHEGNDMADKMTRAGAVDYLTKGGPMDALVASIRKHTVQAAV